MEIVSEKPQQRISKLCQSNAIVLNPFQKVKQRLGGKLHLNENRREQELTKLTTLKTQAVRAS